MPYKQTATPCVVRLVALRGLSPATRLQCQALRAEAGRWWTDLLTLHAHARLQGHWLGAGEFEQAQASMSCTARACRRSARNSPPAWRRLPRWSCAGRSWLILDTSRSPLRTTPKPIRW